LTGAIKPLGGKGFAAMVCVFRIGFGLLPAFLRLPGRNHARTIGESTDSVFAFVLRCRGSFAAFAARGAVVAVLRFKQQLKFYIKACDLRAAELARRAGISKQLVSNWLGGVPPRDCTKVKAVAEVFGVTIDHLMFGHGAEDAHGSRESAGIVATEIPCPSNGPGEVCLTGIFEGRLKLAYALSCMQDLTPKPAVQPCIQRADLLAMACNAFFNLSKDLLIIGTFDRRYREFNAQWEVVLGYTREELMAMPALEMFHPDDRERMHLQMMAGANGASEAHRGELRMVCKSGEVKHFEWHGMVARESQVFFGMACEIRR
jgi:PAS domain S-box-containing protein